MMKSWFLLARQVLVCAIMMFCFARLMGITASYAQVKATEDTTPPEQSVCIMCHKDAVESMSMTKHDVMSDSRTPYGSGEACNSCHTNSDEHLKNPMEVKPLSFGKEIDGHERSEPCQACHSGKERMHLVGSQHERSDVACADCHNIHTPKDQVLVEETQAGVCYECHKDVRSATMRASAHPIRTGEMTCASCHEPHGTLGDANLIKTTVNETCFTCHADKRGPFLWEHPPSAEDCSNCHNAHGTNNRSMLETRGPFLCQECHANAYHPSYVYSQLNLRPGQSAGDKVLAQNCMNCHPKVHGSNYPSGARFTR